MALIKCANCGKEISDKASKCVHCGTTDFLNNKKTIKEEKNGVEEDSEKIKELKKNTE